jgi:F-type H+-transporting ATPase subunit epsilon
MQINLEIVTPERVAYTDTIDMVTVPGVDGVLGILPRHAPLFAQLQEGEVKIKKGNQELFLSIGGGFIEVTKDKVMILVTQAKHADELNETEINQAKQKAVEALKQKITPQEKLIAQAMLRQSIVDLSLLRKRKSRH